MKKPESKLNAQQAEKEKDELGNVVLAETIILEFIKKRPKDQRLSKRNKVGDRRHGKKRDNPSAMFFGKLPHFPYKKKGWLFSNFCNYAHTKKPVFNISNYIAQGSFWETLSVRVLKNSRRNR
ncbi:MAG: hypothetical protein A2945_04225 [Candidatus Liptonbacteria bacterium RIFCSPLOWO2_01_FULL_52_25]|uniref:Uncharacterized protein n=1 Tax=Candidatus Liptonbacteria bacterium RIFCSPLOWO2_01_FULL_52_25 TaxID=1798650 RepID=A0A1G2CCM8_9BACT|nr:MAG: hypothetical protein A2945_04225 [Candidatus Liptonbacteria bacterium RIFCSPLOWO2_01_FULL_52_25]